MSRLDLLNKEAEKIKKCKECKRGKIGKAVPGEGSPDAQVVFVGEAPGKTEAKESRPFIGRSGKYLRSLIKKFGLSASEIYITSPVKYLPKRGTPALSDIKHGFSHLSLQLEIINPKIIILLGNTAYKALIGNDASAYSKHGSTFKKDNRIYFITFHPAAAIRFPKIKKLIEEDFKKLMQLIN